MHRSLVLLLVLLAGAPLASAQRMVGSAVGRWAIQFPSGLSTQGEQPMRIPTQIGEVVMHMTMAQDSGGSRMMMVAWCDYPATVFENGGSREEEIGRMFDSAREGGLRNIQNARLLSEEKIDLDGLPGRSIRFVGTMQEQPVYARFDYYIDVPRLYQVGYIAMEEASVGSGDVRRSFTSFTVTPQSSGGSGQ